MIVTVCGAYRNCGDHLIGFRARELLRTYVDEDIEVVDRKAVDDETYALFNRARAVILCGGPAWQREAYPKVYPIERERIKPPLVPMGLGWKAPSGKLPNTFKFEPPAQAFVQDVHARIAYSSARDPVTLAMLNHAGVDNVLMTGCPAWYALESFEQSYKHSDTVGNVVLSMPAIMQPGVYELMEWLTERFPKAKRSAGFHHGIIPNDSPAGLKTGEEFTRFARAAEARGWEAVGLENSLPNMRALYDPCEFHIGYRVHAHLYCLSRRIPGVLINEDIRGVGQARAVRAPVLNIDGDNIEAIKAAVEAHFETRGAGVERAVETMRETFPVMRRFLQTIADLPA